MYSSWWTGHMNAMVDLDKKVKGKKLYVTKKEGKKPLGFWHSKNEKRNIHTQD